ncbi:hypothetical protein [Mycobacterium sp. NPDC050853]|uniref:hypothetical protein n=1 Tax=Mycobacterium sp. NPDC050853 TaxID=3155160 RepID=UPI0033C6012A
MMPISMGLTRHGGRVSALLDCIYRVQAAPPREVQPLPVSDYKRTDSTTKPRTATTAVAAPQAITDSMIMRLSLIIFSPLLTFFSAADPILFPQDNFR